MTNFGTINETFKNLLAESIVNQEIKGKKVFKKYVNELKKNSILNYQYKIFENLENRSEKDSKKAYTYIIEAISIIKDNFTIEEIVKENRRLVKFLKNNGYSLFESYDNNELHNNIYYLLTTEKNPTTLNKIMESIDFISDYMGNNEKVINESKKDKREAIYSNKTLGTVLVDKFNKKYADLNEDDKKIIKLKINGTVNEKETYFNEVVRECVDLTNNNLLECTIDEKDKLLQVKDKLLRYEFSEEIFSENIISLINLKNDLKSE